MEMKTKLRGNFENTGKLAKFMLRRERRTAIMWIAILGAVVILLVPGMAAIMEGDAMAEMASMMENPAMVSMIGPAYAMLDPDNFGALYTNLMFLFTALTAGIMNIFLIVRHTRADEEQGRYEVVRSLPVGRLSNLSAAFITAAVVNAVLSVVIGLGMFALGDGSMSFGGSMLWGAGLGAAGLVFAATAALFSQLSSSSRGAASYSFAALIIMYFLRAAGDMSAEDGVIVSDHPLSLSSPLGLINRAAPYAGDYWGYIFIALAIAAVIALAAYKLNAVRDIDQGIIPARPGRAHASPLLSSPFGLTFRLSRTALIWSVIGMFALGASYAAVLADVDNFVAQNDFYRDLILLPAGVTFEVMEGMNTEEIVSAMNAVLSHAGFTITELFASMVNNIMAIFALVAPLLFVLRAKSEEKAIRAELILATPASRANYLAGFAAIAFAAPVLMQSALSVGLYSVAQSILPNPDLITFGFLFEAAMVYVPAMWVMAALTILLVGLVPKLTGLIWGYYGYSFLVVFIGRLDVFPSWLRYTTPVGFVPQLPMDETNFVTLVLLTAAAAVLTAAGFVFYTKRDINTV